MKKNGEAGWTVVPRWAAPKEHLLGRQGHSLGPPTSHPGCGRGRGSGGVAQRAGGGASSWRKHCSLGVRFPTEVTTAEEQHVK